MTFPRRSVIILFFVKLLVSVVFLILLKDKLDWESLYQKILALISLQSLVFFLLLIAISLGAIALESIRWRMIIPTKISFNDSFKSVLAAQSLGFFFPSGLGTISGRFLFLKETEISKVGGYTIVANVTQIYSLLLLGCLGLPFLPLIPKGNIWSLGLFLLVAISLWSAKPISQFLANRFSWSANWLKFGSIPIQLRTQFTLFSLFRYLIYSVQSWLMLRFLNADMSLLLGLVVCGIPFFIESALPLIPALDLGFRGSVSIWVFSQFGISNEIALLLSTMIWLFNVTVPSIIGMFIWWRWR